MYYGTKPCHCHYKKTEYLERYLKKKTGGNALRPRRVFTKTKQGDKLKLYALIVQRPQVDTKAVNLNKKEVLMKEIPKIEGEWVGYKASYNMETGKVEPVPEKWIPQAYMEWGVVVKGLEHMSSIKMERDKELIKMKETLILPKVGCEEDAVATEAALVEIPYQDHSFVPFLEGSFSFGPSLLNKDSMGDMLATMAYNDTEPGSTDKKISRIQMQICFATNRIHLVKERWDGQYSGGESLIGCGGNIKPFDDDERLDPSDLLKFVKGKKLTWSQSDNPDMMTSEQDTDSVVPWAVKQILFDWYLPANTHVRCVFGENEYFCLQTGWLPNPSSYFLLSREYNRNGNFTTASCFWSQAD
eukprot:jgi/Galph1/778/GphlegSOOS_G5484.1